MTLTAWLSKVISLNSPKERTSPLLIFWPETLVVRSGTSFAVPVARGVIVTLLLGGVVLPSLVMPTTAKEQAEPLVRPRTTSAGSASGSLVSSLWVGLIWRTFHPTTRSSSSCGFQRR